MERAARAISSSALRRFPQSLRVGARILAGSGNNGGDGVASGRILQSWGFPVEIWRTFAPRPQCGTSDSDWQWQIASCFQGATFVSSEEADSRLEADPPYPGLWIDAILGTGFKGPLRDRLTRLIRILNRRCEAVLAIDVPSGMDADTGFPSPVAVHATATVTLGALKPGLVAAQGLEYSGPVEVADIGWPRRLRVEC